MAAGSEMLLELDIDGDQTTERLWLDHCDRLSWEADQTELMGTLGGGPAAAAEPMAVLHTDLRMCA